MTRGKYELVIVFVFVLPYPLYYMKDEMCMLFVLCYLSLNIGHIMLVIVHSAVGRAESGGIQLGVMSLVKVVV